MAQQLLPAPLAGREGKLVFKTAPSRFLVFPDGLAVWGCLLMPFTERALPEIWEMGTNAEAKTRLQEAKSTDVSRNPRVAFPLHHYGCGTPFIARILM